MTEELTGLPDLESAIVAVYRGPLEEFVQRRDALAKQLRASKRREDADAAKALRKPSRTAWALNHAVHDDPAPIERLADAVDAALEAQAGGGTDLRATLEEVRARARDFADAAARAATESGQSTHAVSLVPAILAVIGDASAFEALRAGRLAEIPEGGGLDFLTAAPPAGAPAPKIRLVPAAPEPPAGETELALARTELQQLEATLMDLRERARAAHRTVQDAQARLDDAEQQLRRAQDEADTRRTELERARKVAQGALAEEQDADRAVAEARARIQRMA